MPKMTFEEISAQSPKDVDNQQWAVYSLKCCWWTTFPEDVGFIPIIRELGAKFQFSQACCPHCYSPLHKILLADFLIVVSYQPERYGLGNLDTLVAAHSRNANYCARNWRDYLPT